MNYSEVIEFVKKKTSENRKTFKLSVQKPL